MVRRNILVIKSWKTNTHRRDWNFTYSPEMIAVSFSQHGCYISNLNCWFTGSRKTSQTPDCWFSQMSLLLIIFWYESSRTRICSRREEMKTSRQLAPSMSCGVSWWLSVASQLTAAFKIFSDTVVDNIVAIWCPEIIMGTGIGMNILNKKKKKLPGNTSASVFIVHILFVNDFCKRYVLNFFLARF